MKKSRIILTFLCMFAIVGGVLAFKMNTNNKFIGTLYCSYSPTTSCTRLVTGISLTITVSTDDYIAGYCTTVAGGVANTLTYLNNE